jgi:hypothetical protein
MKQVLSESAFTSRLCRFPSPSVTITVHYSPKQIRWRRQGEDGVGRYFADFRFAAQ